MKGNQEKHIRDAQVINTAIEWLQEAKQLISQHPDWSYTDNNESKLHNMHTLTRSYAEMNKIIRRLEKVNS